MAKITSEVLAKQLKNGDIGKKRNAVYLLYGAEPGRISDAANALKKALLPNLGSDDDYFRYLQTGTGSEETDIRDVIAQLNTVSMFGGGKLVWLGHLDKIDKVTEEPLLSYCKDPNPQSALIITIVFDKESWGNPVAKFGKSSFFKEMVKTSVVVLLKAPEKKDLPRWVTSRLSAKELTIEHDAVDLLIELCGHDTTRLATEIVKLSDYVDGQTEVTIDDVEVTVGDFRTEKIWGLTNALGRLDNAGAHAALLNLLENNTPAQVILKILTTEIMRIAAALDCRLRGESFNTFCAELGGLPYPLKIVWANSEGKTGWTPELAQRGLRATLKAYMDIMKGGVSPETGLHAMLLDILQPGASKTR
jgi:DNA polymerase III delta subunit